MAAAADKSKRQSFFWFISWNDGDLFSCYKWSVYLHSVGIDIVSSRLQVNAKEIYKRIPKQFTENKLVYLFLYTCV